jgi:hypothetical protein
MPVLTAEPWQPRALEIYGKRCEALALFDFAGSLLLDEDVLSCHFPLQCTTSHKREDLPSFDSSTLDSSTALRLLPSYRTLSRAISSSGESESHGESLALEDLFFCVCKSAVSNESRSSRAEFRLLFVQDERGTMRAIMRKIHSAVQRQIGAANEEE